MDFCKNLFVICFGGLLYYLIEIISRGYSYGSMFLLGGICFWICGAINLRSKTKYTFFQQMVLSMLVIVWFELITGIFLNLLLKLDIWDYSGLHLHLYGQISARYAILWLLLSSVLIPCEDWLRYVVYHDEKPYYII